MARSAVAAKQARMAAGVGALALAAAAGPALGQGMPGAFGGGMPRVGGQTNGVGGIATATVLYDPQAARGNDDVANARGLEQEELTYRLFGNLNAGRRLAGFDATLTGNADFSLHDKNEQLNTRTYGLASTIGREFGACNASAFVGGTQRQSLLEQSDLSYLRNTSEAVNLGAGVGCAAPAGLLGGIQGAYAASYNDAPRSRDSDNALVSAFIGYGNANFGTVDFNVTYANANYEDDLTTPLLVPTPGVERLTYGLRYSRPLIRNLTGSVSLGFAITDPEDFADGRTTDFAAAANLDYRLGKRIAVTFLYNQNTTASDLAGAAYNYVRDLNGTITYSPNQALTLVGAVRYRKSNYRGQVMLPSGVQSDVVDLAKTSDLTFFTSASYRFGDRFVATLGYSERHGENLSIIPLDLTPISQLRDDVSRRIDGSIGIELPFNSRLLLNANYERREASTDDFDFEAFRAGASLSVQF